VLLREHAGPAQVSSHLFDSTLRAAMSVPHVAGLSSAPSPVPAEPSSKAASASQPAFWWRRSVLTILALVATATVAAAGGALILGNGIGGSPAGAVAPAAPTQGTASDGMPPSCH
jgi:hypothetical protein